MNEMSTILIADSHPGIAVGVKSALERIREFIVQGKIAETGQETINIALVVNPDIIVLDIDMPDMSSLDILKTLKEKNCSSKVIVWTAKREGRYRRYLELMKNGAVGCLKKTMNDNRLLDAIDAAKQGLLYFEPNLARHLFNSSNTNVPVSASVHSTLANYLKTPTITMLIGDASPMIQGGVRDILTSLDGFIVTDEQARLGEEVIEKSLRLKPELILLDIDMPDMDGLDILNKLRENGNTSKIIVWTEDEDNLFYRCAELIKFGVNGCLKKSLKESVLLKAAMTVKSGGIYIDPAIAQGIFGQTTISDNMYQDIEKFLKAPKTRVLVADNRPAIRNAIKTMLSQIAGVDVVSVPEEPVMYSEVLQAVRKTKPDVLILDMDMRGKVYAQGKISCVDAVRTIKEDEDLSSIKIIAGTNLSENRITRFVELLQAGCDCVVRKNLQNDVLFVAMEHIRRGENYVEPEVSKIIFGSEEVPSDIKSFLTNMKPLDNIINILIADDSEVMRLALKKMLSSIDGFIVIDDMAKDGNEAYEKCKQYNPDIMLLDINMPGKDGLEVARRLRDINSETKIIALTVNDADNYVLEMLRCGAKGYMLKDIDMDEMVQGIRKVKAGEVFVQQRLVQQVFKTDHLPQDFEITSQAQEMARFTNRDIEVIRCICFGMNNDSIAEHLGINKKNAENIKSRICKKAGINDREITRYALRHRIVTVEELQNDNLIVKIKPPKPPKPETIKLTKDELDELINKAVAAKMRENDGTENKEYNEPRK